MNEFVIEKRKHKLHDWTVYKKFDDFDIAIQTLNHINPRHISMVSEYTMYRLHDTVHNMYYYGKLPICIHHKNI
jgi:hypothetical protein